MKKSKILLPYPTGVTLIVVPVFYLFSDRELRHPSTVWLNLYQLYSLCSMKGDEDASMLKEFIDPADISQVLTYLPVLAQTEEKYLQYEQYIRSQGFVHSRRIQHEFALHTWCAGLPDHEAEKAPVVLSDNDKPSNIFAKNVCKIFSMTLQEFFEAPSTSPGKQALVLAMRRKGIDFKQICAICLISRQQAQIAAMQADIEQSKNPKFKEKLERLEQLLGEHPTT